MKQSPGVLTVLINLIVVQEIVFHVRWVNNHDIYIIDLNVETVTGDIIEMMKANRIVFLVNLDIFQVIATHEQVVQDVQLALTEAPVAPNHGIVFLVVEVKFSQELVVVSTVIVVLPVRLEKHQIETSLLV